MPRQSGSRQLDVCKIYTTDTITMDASEPIPTCSALVRVSFEVHALHVSSERTPYLGVEIGRLAGQKLSSLRPFIRHVLV